MNNPTKNKASISVPPVGDSLFTLKEAQTILDLQFLLVMIGQFIFASVILLYLLMVVQIQLASRQLVWEESKGNC